MRPRRSGKNVIGYARDWRVQERRNAARVLGADGADMPTYDIRGISVEFPFKAYDLQARGGRFRPPCTYTYGIHVRTISKGFIICPRLGSLADPVHDEGH